MSVDYQSSQFVEISSVFGGREVEFVIGLECTHVGSPPYFDPVHGGDPGSEAEFNMVNIAYLDEEGNSVGFDGSLGLVSSGFIKAFLGNDLYDTMIDAAHEDAVNNYYPGDC